MVVFAWRATVHVRRMVEYIEKPEFTKVELKELYEKSSSMSRTEIDGYRRQLYCEIAMAASALLYLNK